MIIIGADYHAGFQQIAFVDTETGDGGAEMRWEFLAGGALGSAFALKSLSAPVQQSSAAALEGR